MMTAMAGVLGSKAQSYVLDRPTFTTANTAGLFGLTRLKASYSNSVCRIRANTTLAEANVNLAGDRVTLNSEVIVLVKGSSSFTVFDRVPLSTFLGTQSAVLLALYDQSGNGRFLDSKYSTATYPIFATNGVLETINGICSIKGTTSSHLYGNIGSRSIGEFTTVFVTRRTASNGYVRFVSFSNGTANDSYTNGQYGNTALDTGAFCITTGGGANQIAVERTNTIVVSSALNNPETAIVCIWAQNNVFYISKNNGAPSGVGTIANAFTFNTLSVLGAAAGSNYNDSNINDIMSFNFMLSAQDRTDLVKELGAKYGITVA